MAYPLHPFIAALNLPRLEGEELAAIVDSVAEQGVIKPLEIWDGHLIDGRERQFAVEVLRARGILRELPIDEWDGQGSLIARWAALNLHRRHLDASRRAMLAAQIPDVLEAEARMRPEAASFLAGLAGNGAELVPRPETPVKTPKSPQEWAAGLMQVSARYVRLARQVAREGSDELVKAVKTGKVSLRRGARLTELPPQQQLEAIAGQRKKARATIAGAKIREAFGRGGRLWEEGAAHVARAVGNLERALAAFRKAGGELQGYDAAKLLGRIQLDIDLVTECRDQVTQTAKQIHVAGAKLATRAQAAA
jgi:hypothetical protein